VADADVVVDGCPDLGGECRACARDDATAAGPAKDVVIRDGGRIRRAVVGLKVRECADQVLSSLAAEDAEDIDAGQARFQPA
jgi:hypothetical protein